MGGKKACRKGFSFLVFFQFVFTLHVSPPPQGKGPYYPFPHLRVKLQRDPKDRSVSGELPQFSACHSMKQLQAKRGNRIDTVWHVLLVDVLLTVMHTKTIVNKNISFNRDHIIVGFTEQSSCSSHILFTLASHFPCHHVPSQCSSRLKAGRHFIPWLPLGFGSSPSVIAMLKMAYPSHSGLSYAINKQAHKGSICFMRTWCLNESFRLCRFIVASVAKLMQ